MQTLPITLQKRLDHSFGRGGFGSLEFSEQHPGDTGMLGNEFDMTHEHRPQRSQRRLNALCSAIDARQQMFRHPLHHRLPYRLLVRKMTKQRALGQMHLPGNGGSCDFAGVFRCSQRHHCLHCHRPPFIGRKILRTYIQVCPLQKIVINYYFIMRVGNRQEIQLDRMTDNYPQQTGGR